MERIKTPRINRVSLKHDKETTQISYLRINGALVVSLGAEGAEVGAWAGEQVLSSAGTVPGRGAPAAEPVGAARPWLLRAPLLHSLRTGPACGARGIHRSTALLLRRLKAGACSSILLKHLSAPPSGLCGGEGGRFPSEVFAAGGWRTLALEASVAAIWALGVALPHSSEYLFQGPQDPLGLFLSESCKSSRERQVQTSRTTIHGLFLKPFRLIYFFFFKSPQIKLTLKIAPLEKRATEIADFCRDFTSGSSVLDAESTHHISSRCVSDGVLWIDLRPRFY